jgi:acetyl/propionyl-CoA carboxylase alpha subunit
MRVIQAARELGRPISLVALHAEAERDAPFVRHADEAVCVGEAVDQTALERALRRSGADGVWAGWSPLVDHAELAELCERLGVLFIGPEAAALRR